VLIRNGVREVDQGKFGPDVLQEFALEFLERHRNRPFLLYYPMVLTHGHNVLEPVVPTPLNRGKTLSEHEMFGDMLAYADRQIGEVVSKLDALGLREQTLVIVASDNGTESAQTASRGGKPVRGGLYQLTEAGSDVALIANCPSRIPGGRTVALTDFTDVFPTLCEMAGVAIPGHLVLDGKSQASVLKGRPAAESPRQWIFNQYDSRRVVRNRRYKLYSTGELFDVEDDREEQHNLAASAEPEVLAAKSRLASYLESLPPNAAPPLELRSLSEFKLRPRRQR
jgi:arylsulfatase A-like enzyme